MSTAHDQPLIPILYEDNHLLAVVKPPGIPSQADDSGDEDMLTLLKSDLKRRYDKPGNVFLGLVHRLDRPVGGVMLFAKTSKAASRLSEAVRSRTFGKTYLAVLTGTPARTSGQLTHHLTKDSRTNTVQAFDHPVSGSKEARLDYRILATASGTALAYIRLHTGRSHQIRVQMAAIGCPLVGDRKYGSQSGTSIVHNIALWSAAIEVAHPVTKEKLRISAAPLQQGSWAPWNEALLQAAVDSAE
ncbi:RNA pseudouridine synthase [Paenibacillaceae bacterium]|nr:RNA pseudouridine synthase [Paenibacillaceae bacterium]